ncbi:MAG TPA: MarR family transcriptional regulator [Micromonosporaceae bacterium]
MVQSLDEARMACWRSFIESSQRLVLQLEDDLRSDSELNLADYHVLVLLSEADGQRLRMGELASRMVFSPSRLTYQISAMERRGLVIRENCPEDRRGSRAVMTAAGLLALQRAAPGHLAAVRRHLMDDLDEAEVACLTRVFDRLGARLQGARTATAAPTKAER